MRPAITAAVLLLALVGCGNPASERESPLPVPRYPAPPASKDSGFIHRAAEEGLGRMNADVGAKVGRGVCDDLYAGRSRQEAIDAGARRHGLHRDDMAVVARLAVEVYCPELG